MHMSVFIRPHVVLNLYAVFYWRNTKGKKSLHGFCQTVILFEFIVTTTVKRLKGWGGKTHTIKSTIQVQHIYSVSSCTIVLSEKCFLDIL